MELFLTGREKILQIDQRTRTFAFTRASKTWTSEQNTPVKLLLKLKTTA
jgi:hypothetical protein